MEVTIIEQIEQDVRSHYGDLASFAHFIYRLNTKGWTVRQYTKSEDVMINNDRTYRYEVLIERTRRVGVPHKAGG